ncbi:hypothetical protein BVC71_14160 [Marivivens niveibacter]|uniref:BD-FAE-like domain-containing protein n=1 Tax=Marivivens niveibacter TaxID=1930667 RepID=A0A251WV87_9RHOB|nr:subtype B tannase [Marivivens niveibacter]OUD08312.1 hypothetical protein BVC71_14160 [Marivivens niveibacter]
MKVIPTACTAALLAGTAMSSVAQGVYDDALRLDPNSYETLTVTVDGEPMAVRRYEAVYVGNPVAMSATQPARSMGPGGSPASADGQELADLLTYQKMAIYVPEASIEDQSTAMIFAVNNAGWFASELRTSVETGGEYVSTSDTDKVGAALGAGYVFVDVGTRGRGIVAADGTAAGKAPAAIVDAKAAIRFLRLNDDVLPGSAERIVITGTSGGGGLSTAVAASGNASDYFPYLAEIGAAGIDADGASSLNDDVFATIAYCPITSLGYADMAYEWLYQAQRDEQLTGVSLEASQTLRSQYPSYLESLGLVLDDGTPLTADNMTDLLMQIVTQEIQDHIDEGGSVPALGEMFEFTSRGQTVEVENTWLSVVDGQIVPFEIQDFLTFVTQTSALKSVPAFDRTANSGNEGVDGENTLFGPAAQEYSNFTPFGWNMNEVAGDGSGADDTGLKWNEFVETKEGQAIAAQVKLTDPQAFLQGNADSAPYWYIRHGMIDRDTSFAVELALYRAVAGTDGVKDVNFTLPWMTPHSGNYDVQEAYGWLASVLSDAE